MLTQHTARPSSLIYLYQRKCPEIQYPHPPRHSSSNLLGSGTFPLYPNNQPFLLYIYLHHVFHTHYSSPLGCRWSQCFQLSRGCGIDLQQSHRSKEWSWQMSSTMEPSRNRTYNNVPRYISFASTV